MPAATAVVLSTDTVLAGRYRVERVLGEGGMGVVLQAQHVDLEHRVAIKMLRPELADEPEVVERFLREGRAAARIESDHVVRVVDVVRADDGSPLLVMELLDGHDLSTVRGKRTPLPVKTAVEYVLQACDALTKAHAIGIVHRDLKPANLFVTRRRDGRELVKVLDFGISKVPSRSGATTSMTRTTAVMGSAEYMSPEHMMSTRDVDARTDIWALGVVLYELCTAEVPFPGDSITQVCALVMSRPPASPRSLRPDMPPALEAVILRCLEKEKDARFASVDELVGALQAALAIESVAALRLEADRPAPEVDLAMGATLMAGARAPSSSSADRSRLAAAAATTDEVSPEPIDRPGSSTTLAATSEPIPQPPQVGGPSRLVVGSIVAAVALGLAVPIMIGASEDAGQSRATSAAVSAAAGTTVVTSTPPGRPTSLSTTSATAPVVLPVEEVPMRVAPSPSSSSPSSTPVTKPSKSATSPKASTSGQERPAPPRQSATVPPSAPPPSATPHIVHRSGID